MKSMLARICRLEAAGAPELRRQAQSRAIAEAILANRKLLGPNEVPAPEEDDASDLPPARTIAEAILRARARLQSSAARSGKQAE